MANIYEHNKILTCARVILKVRTISCPWETKSRWWGPPLTTQTKTPFTMRMVIWKLRDNRLEVLRVILKGEELVVVLSTGYGKN